MNIDRHNYEEYFLLYIDKELTAKENLAVEAFIEANPDLQIEITALKNSILKKEEIRFEAKEILNKISEPLYEKLLLYLDHELEATEIEHIERAISDTPVLAKEYEILQQTKLKPDTTIVFTPKSSLYRKEGGKIIAFPWKRIAVAAVLLGFGIWGFVGLNKTNESIDLSLNTNQPKQKIKSTPVYNNQSTIEGKKAEVNIVTGMDAGASVAQSNNISGKNPKKNIVLSAQEKRNVTDKKELAIVSEQSNNNPDLALQQNIYSESNKKSMANVLHEEQGNSDMAIGIADSNKKLAELKTNKNEVLSAIETNSFAQNASYSENNNESNDNRILYIKEAKLRNTPLGSFFRKVKKVIDEKNNIHIGKSINVGNVEIAFH